MRLREREARDDFVHLHLHTHKLTSTDTHAYTPRTAYINVEFFFFKNSFFCTNEPSVRRHCLCWRIYLLHRPPPMVPLFLQCWLRPRIQPFCSRLAFCLVLRSVAVVISVAAAAVHAFVAVSLRESPSVPLCRCVARGLCVFCYIVVVVLTAQLLAH